MISRSSRSFLGLALVLLFVGAAVMGAKMISFAFSPARPGATESSVIEVRKGEGPVEITKALSASGAISSTGRFVWLGRALRQWHRVKAGEYKVSPAMSPLELFSTITSGISVLHPVTIPEGDNIYEIADELESKGLAKKIRVLELCRSPKFMASLGLAPPLPPSLEGYLFPDTYYFVRSSSPEEMLRQMYRHAADLWTPKQEARARELHLTRHELLTLASMVEKETGAPQDRKSIASVFFNRIQKRMKLQSDPTTIYGIWERYDGNIHRSDLASQTPYNTYYVPSLPIGPIANPGREAIDAVLYPETTSYLYFVSHNDGTTEFTGTLEAHNQAVRKYQLDPKAREGKSWRDLARKVQPQATPNKQ